MKPKYPACFLFALALFLVSTSPANATLTYQVHYANHFYYNGQWIYGGDYEYVTSDFITDTTILYPSDLSNYNFNSPIPLLYVKVQNPMTNVTGPSGPLMMAFFDSNGDGSWDETMGFGVNGPVDHVGLYSNLDGSYVSITESSPVPAPGAVWLFGSGIVGLIGLRKRMRK